MKTTNKTYGAPMNNFCVECGAVYGRHIGPEYCSVECETVASAKNRAVGKARDAARREAHAANDAHWASVQFDEVEAARTIANNPDSFAALILAAVL